MSRLGAPGRILGVAIGVALAALGAGCRVNRKIADPIVEMHTAGGVELAVSTDYGLVFLGRGAESGEGEAWAWFGDGPSQEACMVESLGGGLFTAETEIRLPSVPLTFISPPAGTEVLVMGRDGGASWSLAARVAEHPSVYGLLLELPSGFADRAASVGAGVFVEQAPTWRYERSYQGLRLLGLVAGHVEIATADGRREFLAVVGPTELWRLVAWRREHPEKPRFVYREDVL
jgi:hypothetical protein